jgi:HSP20 family protein
MEDRIMHRAYDIFRRNGDSFGKDLDNWLTAERETVWKPPIELKEKDHHFEVTMPVAGVDPNDLDIEITPDDLLVKAETRHEHKEDKVEVHTCEFESGRLFRAVRFPKKIDPDKVKAEFKNGLLTISAAIAEETRAKKVTINAA